MFTSEPSLAQRIGRMIGDTPIIDSHSRISAERPGSPDLAALIGHRPVRAELIAAGMPPKDLDASLPPDERVRRSLPYLARTRNTATAWSLFRIFRDLYDFEDPQLTESNYRGLLDRVAATGEDPGWARSVLRDRCNIRGVVTGLGGQGADRSEDRDGFHHRLDLDGLICPGTAGDAGPSFPGGSTKAGYFDALTAVLGEAPATIEGLERLIFDWLDRTVAGRVKLAGTSLPIEHRLTPPDETRRQFALGRASGDRESSDVEVAALSRAVSWSVLRWHHENRRPFRIAVGAEASEDGTILPRARESWAWEMAGVFRHFRGARFDLLIGSDGLAEDVAALAGRLPNVYASGSRGQAAIPMAIERSVALRVQVAPMTRIGGFCSDAPSAEWTYGRFQVVKKATASALARLVEAGYFEEDEIPPLLRQIFHDTPRDLCGLEGN